MGRKTAKGEPAAETALTVQSAIDAPILKTPTGIAGFDEISRGGLPDNRLTAIIGRAGAGKTVFALQTLVNRRKATGTPGIFVTFEEPVERLRHNMAAFDWKFSDFSETGLYFIDARVPLDVMMTGAFDLSGLLAGLSALAEETGARDVVFDGIDMLLTILPDERLERQELARLDEWVRKSGLSAMITIKSVGLGERDQHRADFLQYITDCVVVLEARFMATTSSRDLRIVKYRGSGFLANPVPVVIGPSGFAVLAFKTARANYPTFSDRVSSGVSRLDTLLDGGYIRGSSILISGSPGTSKTSLGASFVAAACDRGDKALFVSFDESATQIVANMNSIGLRLDPHVVSGKLIIASLLSGGQSPEEHFVAISALLEIHAPKCLVIDPLSSLLKPEYHFARIICESLLDHAKLKGVTVVCTSLLDQVSGDQEISASNVSTVADTWIHVSYLAREGERNRALTIIKSRGTNHSNQVRELVLSGSGVDLLDVYVAEGEVLMGSARAQREVQMRRKQAEEAAAYEHASRDLDREIEELKTRLAATAQELSWKQREATFLGAAESSRTEREKTAVETRLELRRADGEGRETPQSARKFRRGS